MPHLASSAKRLRQAKKTTNRRKLTNSQIDFKERQLKKAITTEDKPKALELIRELGKYYDKAAQKGMIHQNTSSRKKSRLTKKVNKINQ